MDSRINFELNALEKELSNCAAQMYKKISLAQILIMHLADMSSSGGAQCNDLDLLSSEPNQIFQYIESDPEGNDTRVARSFDEWSEFHLDPSIASIEAVWNEWKHGGETTPAVEYMNKKFGKLGWTRSADERAEAIARSKIVEELESHLERGRELDEVIIVAELAFDKCHKNTHTFARLIMENLEQQRDTLFEDASSTTSAWN